MPAIMLSMWARDGCLFPAPWAIGQRIDLTGSSSAILAGGLAAFGADPSSRFHLVCLKTCGGGHIILSPFYLIRAISRIVVEAVGGRLAVVHINLADGTSVYRKVMVLFASRLAGECRSCFIFMRAV
jgi:hypothetical protein